VSGVLFPFGRRGTDAILIVPTRLRSSSSFVLVLWRLAQTLQLSPATGLWEALVRNHLPRPSWLYVNSRRNRPSSGFYMSWTFRSFRRSKPLPKRFTGLMVSSSANSLRARWRVTKSRDMGTYPVRLQVVVLSSILTSPPVCMAKTQYSFSHDPKLKGIPTGTLSAWQADAH
jgi:Formate--tetrahydrofolate ligase